LFGSLFESEEKTREILSAEATQRQVSAGRDNNLIVCMSEHSWFNGAMVDFKQQLFFLISPKGIGIYPTELFENQGELAKNFRLFDIDWRLASLKEGSNFCDRFLKMLSAMAFRIDRKKVFIECQAPDLPFTIVTSEKKAGSDTYYGFKFANKKFEIIDAKKELITLVAPLAEVKKKTSLIPIFGSVTDYPELL